MDSGKRKLLYLLPPHGQLLLEQELDAAGWAWRNVAHADDARRLISSRQFHVGLVLLAQPEDWELIDARSIHPGPAMQWVALVSPASMRLAKVSRGIRANFFDYHTLPADSERLLATLGHAHGMATLASSMILSPARQRPPLNLHKARSEAEHEVIERALRKTQNNITKAARELGISRVTLYRLMEKGRLGSG